MYYALITGASKGIGKSIAIELAKRKIPVLLIARSGVLLEQLVAEIRDQYGVKADYLVMDLSEPDTDEKILKWCLANQYTGRTVR